MDDEPIESVVLRDGETFASVRALAAPYSHPSRSGEAPVWTWSTVELLMEQFGLDRERAIILAGGRHVDPKQMIAYRYPGRVGVPTATRIKVALFLRERGLPHRTDDFSTRHEPKPIDTTVTYPKAIEEMAAGFMEDHGLSREEALGWALMI